MEINTSTSLYGIIGKPTEHSLSPYLHNNLFQHYNVNAVYLAFETDDVSSVIKGMRSLNIKGLSVTIPNKVPILPYLDEIDKSANLIGAVNTVINKKNKLFGYNTDVYGVVKSFKTRNIDCNDKTVILFGSGGATRAVVCGLLLNYKVKELVILGRKTEKINNLVALAQSCSKTYSSGYIINNVSLQNNIERADIIVNTSSVGMIPKIEAIPFSSDLLQKGQIVFDVVYNPVKTKLLQIAEENGCVTIPGIDMFIFQAYRQFNLFTEIDPDLELIKELILKKIQ